MRLRKALKFFCLPNAVILAVCMGVYSNVTSARTFSPSIGLNKFELFLQYLGRASGGDATAGYTRITQAMARKSLDDSQDVGVSYVRVSMVGYAPSEHAQQGDMELWRRDPAAFWAAMDTMMDDLDARGIRLVPVFLWNPMQFPAMTGENVAQMVTEPNSKAWQLLARYVSDFVGRYRMRSTVLFYELTNEFNLWADLDHVGRCRKKTAPVRYCAVMGNFTTDQMIAFSARFADMLRTLDPGRTVSSGYSIPRAAAGHLRARPEWSPAGADWTRDSKQLFARQLLDLHKHLDIVSVHLYDSLDNLRFGLPDAASLLDVIKDISDVAGKPLFVGEFGDAKATADPAHSHAGKTLRKIVERRVPYSAVWAWQYYQTSPYETHNSEATVSSLEPGAGDSMISAIRRANESLRQSGGASAVVPDRQAPRVVLTWPLACSMLKTRQLLHAVASDNEGVVGGIEFLVDGKRVAVDVSFPYQVTLDVASLKRGLHTLTARARDRAGNVAEYSTKVFAGVLGDHGSCLAH